MLHEYYSPKALPGFSLPGPSGCERTETPDFPRNSAYYIAAHATFSLPFHAFCSVASWIYLIPGPPPWFSSQGGSVTGMGSLSGGVQRCNSQLLPAAHATFSLPFHAFCSVASWIYLIPGPPPWFSSQTSHLMSFEKTETRP